MPNALLLLTLSQFAMWTDSAGVVHVASPSEAPRGSTALEGGSYSVIDADGRPLVMPDGGARADDSAWWRARFEEARSSLQVSVALETDGAHDLEAARVEVCATATAQATSRVRIVAQGKQAAVFVEDRAQEVGVRALAQRASPAEHLGSHVVGRACEIGLLRGER